LRERERILERAMRFCISETSTMPSSFCEDVEAFAAAGCQGMEVWLTKLEKELENYTAADLRKRVEEKQVTLAAASYQGGLLLSQGEQRRTHFDHFKRRLDLCQTFGIPTLLLVADFVHQVDALAMERAVVSLGQAAQWAAGFGVTLALEFRGSDTFCASLDTAVMLIEQAGEPNLGVNLDVFHYYKGPSKLEDLERLVKQKPAFVQICDVAGVPRELMTDSDRIFPGEGDFQLLPIMHKLRAIGYEGWVSLELWNPTIWQSPPQQVAEFGLAAWNRLVAAVTP
jgi:2-keto-myo-inositol isomerase